MKKNALFRILNQAERAEVVRLGREIEEKHPVTILRKPEIMLVMLKVRESARNSLFYACEALACECTVMLGDTKGFAAGLNDDMEKIYAMAVIDAALNGNLPECALIMDRLGIWEEAIQAKHAYDAKLAMSTKVNFTVMEE
ncbi:MAG: phosphonate C-P lyase system protein PhnG [Clostridiales bacterium]|nr:phosphonate C-P lyase system protein PhnG [Clostridiales bacterium]